MENIVHARIDYRLIHGQVITRWLKLSNANHIIIIDDALKKDPFLGMVYTMAAPEGVTVKIVSVEDAESQWNQNRFYSGKVLLLFKSVDSALESVRKGLKLSSLQVGGLENKPGRKLVHNQITLDRADYEKLREIEQKEIEVYFQTVPEEAPASLGKVEKKL